MSVEQKQKQHTAYTRQQLRTSIKQQFMTNHGSPVDPQLSSQKETPDFIPETYAPETESQNVFDKFDTTRTFYHLKDDPLYRLETDIDDTISHKIVLLVYRIRKDLGEPFLEVFFMKNNGEFTLPETDYIPIPTTTPSETDTPFYTQSSRLFEEITGENQKSATEKYKGFVQFKDVKLYNYIVAVFGPIHMPSESRDPKDPTCWGIVDEFYYKKRILNVPIREHVITMFENNPDLIMIKDESGECAKIPYLLYLVENNANVLYDNIVKPKSSDRIDDNTHNLIHPIQVHPVLQNTYLFSVEPLDTRTISRVKRFAVQIDDPLYVFNYGVPLSKVEHIQKIDRKKNIRFYEKSMEMWSVKNAESCVEL